MKQATYTKGNWQVLPEECDRPYIRIRGTVAGLRYKIANVLTPVHENVHAREAEETRANARLIAAAPDLLEALMAIDGRMRGCIALGFSAKEAYESFYKDDVSQAIAKATGAA